MNTPRGRIAFAVCGSFCTLGTATAQAGRLVRQGWELLPVMSFAASRLDTRFGTAAEWKARLEELENRRDELENRLACEKLAKPKVSAEFMTFWLHRFRKLDVRQQSHRKMLIDTFINEIFLYDDKMVITFNYKEGTKTITFAELQEAISNKNGSDLDCLVAP